MNINYIKERVEKIVEKSSILAVFILGSTVRDTLRPDSDIDFGIILEQGAHLSGVNRLEIAGVLSYELGRTVDIGEISSKNLIYAREALLKGKLIYSRDMEKVNIIRANLLGMYIQFNMDRQEVTDAYTAG